MKLSHLVIGSALALSIPMSSVFADIDIMQHMMPINGHIKNLDKAIADAKKNTGITIAFPGFIPKENGDKKYFASSDKNSKQYGFDYMINVDSTPDCNGVKYCNIGNVTARPGALPEMMKDMHNKIITTEVGLADGTKAFYTPGHPMGDYFPANIQWVDNKVLYSITWNVPFKKAPVIEKDALITMANSAKNPGSG